MKKIPQYFLTLALVLSACGTAQTPAEKEALQVVASFYPLAYFAEEIGAENVSVSNLTPAGGEPHGFEPSPRQIVQVTEADVVLYLGLGFEPWMDDLKSELEAKDVVSVEVNSKLPLISNDPHTWLDPLLVQETVVMIMNAFITADPEGADEYRANAELLMAELQAMHENYKNTLAVCETDTILISHNSSTYLAQRYNFKTLSVAGISPEEDPSADRLTELADFAKENESEYIFFETLANPAVAETLADEAELTSLVFNPLEGLTEEELLSGENYFTVMTANLENLKLALSCQ